MARDTRRGKAGERYVATILKSLPKGQYTVTEGFILGPPEVSFHHGDVDFLLTSRGDGPSFLLEVKTGDPSRPGKSAGRTAGDEHAAQAGRGSDAVYECTDGAVDPIPLVVYVDPVDSGEHRLKTFPLKESPTEPGVSSVGARNLKSALRSLSRAAEREREAQSG